VRIVEQALQRLAPGGLLVLYTAAPIVDGLDLLWEALAPRLARAGLRTGTDVRYAEIDPDVFGSELASPAYAQVERISVVGLTLQRPAYAGVGRAAIDALDAHDDRDDDDHGPHRGPRRSLRDPASESGED
jgi:hypothetical protein